MGNEVNPSRRPYRSPLRADQAEQTRRRILESAYRLFAERGYAGTTIAAVAEAAGVSPETIYLSLRGKRGLLEGVIETAIAGAEHHASRDDGWWSSVAALPDPGERLERLVEYSCGVLARTRPIHAVIRGAADKEPFAAELGRRLLDDRLAAQTERIRTYLAEDLRPGLTAEQAGERYVALASPELYHLLTAQLGWTPDAHRSWLTGLLEAELLGPGASPLRSLS
jgi:AcrR family transcriptional regulator